MTTQSDYAKEVHANVRKHFKRRKVLVHKIDDTWAIDLGIMTHEKRGSATYKYILVVIDIFSKFLFVEALKSKTGKEVKQAFKKIFNESNRKPDKIWADKGTEWYNKDFKSFLKENNIELYSTENEGKSCVVERVIQTLKKKMYKKFTELGTKKWLSLLPVIVKEYNNTVHTTTGFTPHDGSLKENEEWIRENVFSEAISLDKPYFKPGDFVRIYKWKNVFEKSYVGNWTKEVFQVVIVLQTNPFTYVVKDSDGEEIKGSFYKEELLKSKFGFKV